MKLIGCEYMRNYLVSQIDFNLFIEKWREI
jgi:hypothetical protein